MTDPNDKPLMRSLGEFFGHIVKGIRTKPGADRSVVETKIEVEEEDRGEVVLRRTTIEEIEVRGKPRPPEDANKDRSGDDDTPCP